MNDNDYKLSVQYALARARSLDQEIKRLKMPKALRQTLRLKLSWLEVEIENIATGHDRHYNSGGVVCGCHEIMHENAKPDCETCQGTGLISHASMMDLAHRTPESQNPHE